MEKSCNFLDKMKLDYIEVFFGVLMDVIVEVKECIGVLILVGGFICIVEDVERVLNVGVIVIMILKCELWKYY